MRVGGRPRSCASARALTGALLAASLALGCARGPASGGNTVSVEVLAQDSAAVRFRICNNGFQPVRRVEFSAGGATFTADTLLGQAHCAEVTRPGSYPPLDPASVVVTRVEEP